MVSSIASAISDQSAGVQNVTSTMQDLDANTHQNTQIAQESLHMAQNLRGQANSVRNVVHEIR